ncbi:MFS transporter [Angustibacter aerolatus]
MSSEGPRGTLRLLQGTAFVATLDRFAMAPVLVAIARDLDVPLTQVVHAAGAYFLAYGLMQPVWGMVSDRLGLVRTMRLSLLLAAVATVVSASVGSVLALGVTRGVAGACFAAAFPATLIYLGDTVPAERRQRDVTDLMVGVAIGTALGSAGAGVLAQVASWRWAFVATGVISLALVVLLRRLPHPPRVRGDDGLLAPLVTAARSGPTRLVLLLALVEGGVLLGVLTLLPPAVEATGAGAALSGGVTAAYGVAVLGFAQLTGRASRTRPSSQLIALGGVAALAGCGVLVVSRTPVAGLVAAVLLGLAWASMHSSLQTWATQVLPGARATVVSLFAGSLFLGSALAALASGAAVDRGAWRTVFVVATVLTVPLALLATRGRRGWERRAPTEP